MTLTDLLSFHFLFDEQRVSRVQSHHRVDGIGRDIAERLTLKVVPVRGEVEWLLSIGNQSDLSVRDVEIHWHKGGLTARQTEASALSSWAIECK